MHYAAFTDAHACFNLNGGGGGGGAKRRDKMCGRCKPVLDSDWLLRHVIVAPESHGSNLLGKTIEIEQIKTFGSQIKPTLLCPKELLAIS